MMHRLNEDSMFGRAVDTENGIPIIRSDIWGFQFLDFWQKKEGILVIIYLGYAEVTRLGFWHLDWKYLGWFWLLGISSLDFAGMTCPGFVEVFGLRLWRHHWFVVSGFLGCLYWDWDTLLGLKFLDDYFISWVVLSPGWHTMHIIMTVSRAGGLLDFLVTAIDLRRLRRIWVLPHGKIRNIWDFIWDPSRLLLMPKEGTPLWSLYTT